MASSLIGQEQIVSIMEKYDQQYLFPILLKCYHIFQPMVEFELVVDMQTHEESNLDIFKCLLEKWANKGGGEQGVTNVPEVSSGCQKH